MKIENIAKASELLDTLNSVKKVLQNGGIDAEKGLKISSKGGQRAGFYYLPENVIIQIDNECKEDITKALEKYQERINKRIEDLLNS
jgi:hypothetical protein